MFCAVLGISQLFYMSGWELLKSTRCFLCVHKPLMYAHTGMNVMYDSHDNWNTLSVHTCIYQWHSSDSSFLTIHWKGEVLKEVHVIRLSCSYRCPFPLFSLLSSYLHLSILLALISDSFIFTPNWKDMWRNAVQIFQFQHGVEDYSYNSTFLLPRFSSFSLTPSFLFMAASFPNRLRVVLLHHKRPGQSDRSVACFKHQTFLKGQWSYFLK